METVDLYTEIEVKVGTDKINKLLLLERANNQKYWAHKIGKAVEYGAQFKDTTRIVTSVVNVLNEMEEQAGRYSKEIVKK